MSTYSLMTAPSAVAPRAAATEAGTAPFQVVVICPEGYAHAGAFAELTETVFFGLRALGFDASLAVNRLVAPGPPAVMFGAHLLTAQEAGRVPASTIIYNLEQIGEPSSWCSPEYLSLLTRCQVWDYSTRNIASLAHLGVRDRVTHVPVGYMPQLTRIASEVAQDIDVLFYGSLNERRTNMIAQLRHRGLNAQALFGVYGPARDALIARAKVVLNLHYYDTSIFELVRVSYLLANRKAVVAECHAGTEIDDDIAGSVRLASYGTLAAACAELVCDEPARRALAEQGFSLMRKRDEAAILARALGLAAPVGLPVP